jgi:hypothetical protein
MSDDRGGIVKCALSIRRANQRLRESEGRRRAEVEKRSRRDNDCVRLLQQLVFAQEDERGSPANSTTASVNI